MKQDKNIFEIIGGIIAIWFGLLLAPILKGGLIKTIKELPKILNNPFKIELEESSLKTAFIFLIIYILIILVLKSNSKNYRNREEYGSAKWGNIAEIRRKYKQKGNKNILLTKNVELGLNARKHRRNLNVVVVGGSGSGKTRTYCKPNILQCNSSYVILDPKRRKFKGYGKCFKSKWLSNKSF